MATAWFLCPYKRRIFPAPHVNRPVRYCAMDDFTTLIRNDGGDWSETEILGNYAIVKVRASDATLETIAASQGFYRLPLRLLSETTNTLHQRVLNTIHDRLLSLGYTEEEITFALGNLKGRTLSEILSFAASRRRKPRYDPYTDNIYLDGPVQACRPIEDVDRQVSDT